MAEESIGQEIKERRNYFIKEIDQNVLMSNKNKLFCTTLNYTQHLFISAFVVTDCISISAFASLLSITIGITSSAIGL